ncbi:MAG: metallophosphoesterase, partial [Bacteroidota bacterium]
TTRRGFQTFDERRRLFLRRGMEGTSALAFGSSAYGVLVGRFEYETDQREIVLQNLDPAFDGLTISFLSDIHSSVFMTRKEMDLYVRLVNDLHSDIIIVGGDFVNGLTEEVYPFAESFSNLKARLGVFGVTGNHDYYTSDPDRVIRVVEECGIRLLHDEKSILSNGSARLTLLGLDDVSTGKKAAERIEAARKGGTEGATILLCHRPYYLPQAAAQGVDLMLSGHTHGGQIVLASFGHLTLTPAALASPYVSGEYRHGNTLMYVSRGIGTVGIPVRLNCPPEITRFTLRSLKPRNP